MNRFSMLINALLLYKDTNDSMLDKCNYLLGCAQIAVNGLISKLSKKGVMQIYI